MFKYIYQIKFEVFLEILFSLFYIICLGALPGLTKQLLDYNIDLGLNGVLRLALIFLVLVALAMFFQYLSQIFAWKANQKFNINIRKALCNKICDYKDSEFNTKDSSYYSSLVINNVDTLYENYVEAIIDIIKSSMMLLVYSYYMFINVDYRVIIVVLIFSLLSLIIPKLTKKHLANKKHNYLLTKANYLQVLTDVFLGHNKLNRYTKKGILNYHNKNLEANENALYDFGKMKSFTITFSSFITRLINVAAFTTLGILFILKEISAGSFAAAFGYIDFYVEPLNWILNDINALNAGIKVKAEIIEILNHEDDKNYLEESINSISFINVEKTFDDFKLENFNYTFEIGKKYAITGHSGSGKSTIFQLLMQQIPLNSGVINFNNINFNNYESKDYIHYIAQDDHIFKTSAMDNISYFDTYKGSKLKDYIPINKYNIINQNEAHNLSAGEKKIISILQFYQQNYKILLLDETLVNIDIENREFIHNQLLNLDDICLIHITHDTSNTNLDKYDEVLTFNKGSLITN